MATGGLNANEVRTAPNGAVYFAPIGTAAPTSSVSALDAAWHHAGYIDEEGIGISPDISTTPIRKWQSVMPVKYTLDEVALEVTFTMNQFNRANTELYYFGAQWTFHAASESRLVVPSSPLISDLERALVVEFEDDRGDMTRYYFPRGIVIEREEQQLNKADVKLGVTYHVMDNNGDMFEIFTSNDDIYSA